MSMRTDFFYSHKRIAQTHIIHHKHCSTVVESHSNCAPSSSVFSCTNICQTIYAVAVLIGSYCMCSKGIQSHGCVCQYVSMSVDTKCTYLTNDNHTKSCEKFCSLSKLSNKTSISIFFTVRPKYNHVSTFL